MTTDVLLTINLNSGPAAAAERHLRRLCQGIRGELKIAQYHYANGVTKPYDDIANLPAHLSAGAERLVIGYRMEGYYKPVPA